MAKALGVILFLTVFAATAVAAPAPFQDPRATSTCPQLKTRLRSRGIAVETVRPSREPNEWIVILELSVIDGGMVGTRVWTIIRASDERAALHALLATGHSAREVHRECEREFLSSWSH